MSVDIAIDLGTSRTRICIPEKKLIIDEPSVITIDLENEKIIAVGDKAYDMLGKTSERFNVMYPLSGGVVCDFDAVHDMITYLLNKIGQGKFTMPRIVACIPAEITDVEKRAVVNAISSTGVRKIYLIEEPVAAALGCGLKIDEPEGFMVVNIGGGTTEIAVLSLGGLASYNSLKIAGDSYDDEIIKYMKSQYGLFIGKRTAEKVKMTIGCTIPFPEEKFMQVKGRDMISGLPKGITIGSNELIEILNIPTKKIVIKLKEILENTPPELIGDVFASGIHFSGGIANLYGLDQIFAQNTGLNVHVPKAPEHSVIEGTCTSLKYIGDLDNKSYGAINPLVEEF